MTPLPTDPSDSANGRGRLVRGPRGPGPDLRVATRLGLSAARLISGAPNTPDDEARRLAFGDVALAARAGRGATSLTAAFTGAGAIGHTIGRDWRRVNAAALLAASGGEMGLRLEGSYAAVNRDAPDFERPMVGGPVAGLFDDALLGQRLAVPALPTAFRTGRQAAVLRASSTMPLVSGALLNGALVGGAALSPYYSLVSAGERLDGWARLVGLEGRAIGPFAPFARVPQARVLGGVAYILDAPLRNRTRAYVSATFVP